MRTFNQIEGTRTDGTQINLNPPPSEIKNRRAQVKITTSPISSLILVRLSGYLKQECWGPIMSPVSCCAVCSCSTLNGDPLSCR